jgi:hypothetical protein
MAHEKISPEEVRAMLSDLAERIEREGETMESVTLTIATDEGEKKHKFRLKTQEERDGALLAIRTLLGQVH